MVIFKGGAGPPS